jgi:N-acetylmuramoyl-L-alanine amidase
MTATLNFTFVLVDAAIKTTLLLGLVTLIASLLHHACAAARHLLWALGLLAALFLPLLSQTLPRFDLALPRTGQVQTRFLTSLSAAASVEKEAGTKPGATAALQAAQAAAGGTVPPPPIWPMGILLVWLLGAGLALMRLAAGLAVVRKIAQGSVPVTGPLEAAAAEACQALAISRPVDFRHEFAPDEVSVPMGWGFLRPTVVLPADAACWPPEQVRAALLHELAHVKRQDWLVQIFTHAVCALYWFHPLVWLAARQVRRESEYASDDLVLGAGIGQADYATYLLHVVRAARTFRAAPAMAVTLIRPSALNRRVNAVLALSSRRQGRTRVMAALVAALMAACVCPLATLRPVAAADQKLAALRGVVVVVDAGHGGRDSGGVGPGGVSEKSLNLAIAERLHMELAQRGAVVFMSRDGDIFSSLKQRTQFANAKHADFLISIHCEAGFSPSYSPATSGVYYHGQSLQGRRLAECIGQGLRQATDRPSGVVSDTTRYISGFAAFREAHMPAVLVECGSMTDTSDLARLRAPAAQQRIAEGIAAGLTAFQKGRPAGTDQK